MKKILKNLPWIDKETAKIIIGIAVIMMPVTAEMVKETYSYLPVWWQIYFCLVWMDVLSIMLYFLGVGFQCLKRAVAFKYVLNIVRAYLSAILCLCVAGLLGIITVPIIGLIIATISK